jgi:hypothetical protein
VDLSVVDEVEGEGVALIMRIRGWIRREEVGVSEFVVVEVDSGRRRLISGNEHQLYAGGYGIASRCYRRDSIWVWYGVDQG